MSLFPHYDFVKITPSSYTKDYLSEAQSLKTIGVSGGGQRWEFELKTSVEFLSVMRGVWMFLCARREIEPFDIQIPLFDNVLGNTSGDVSLSSAKSIGANSVTFSNYTPAIGDFIQFAGHSKVYGIEYADGNTATIFPSLIKDVTSSELVTVNNLRFTVKRVGAMQKVELKNGQQAQVSFKVREDF